MKIIKKILCNHRYSCIPLDDNLGFKVGELCIKCNKFFERKNIPTYEERLDSKINLTRTGI